MTVPCVGWPADPSCDVYGDVHGCALPDEHPGLHLCACGVDSRGQRVPAGIVERVIVHTPPPIPRPRPQPSKKGMIVRLTA